MFKRFTLKVKAMGRLINILGATILTSLVFYTCEPPRSYPDTPEVEFKSLSIENGIDLLGNDVKRIKLTVKVSDGDGDIGLQYEDGSLFNQGADGYDTSNLFIELFEKIDGQFDTVKLKSPHYFATRFLEPEGQDKTLIADFETSIEYSISEFDYDTIKYSFYIKDRAKHKSNIAESPEFPADTLGLID